jgi:hypothetical protein
MKFIRELLSRKSPEKVATIEPLIELKEKRLELEPFAVQKEPASTPKKVSLKVVKGDEIVAASASEKSATADSKILQNVNDQITGELTKSENAAPVNIWDIDGDATAAPAAPATPVSRRRRRNQTRLLGFNDTAEDVVSAFDSAEKVTPTARAQFPVGWVLVSDGPGRGECFTLEAGMSQIGRAEDQAIQLDFGDNSISRVNHAAIVYDANTHTFTLGHGGKKNIVRLNGSPVISNETMTTGDEVKIGETTLRFVALCTEEFNWVAPDDEVEEQDDVAIA